MTAMLYFAQPFGRKGGSLRLYIALYTTIVAFKPLTVHLLQQMVVCCATKDRNRGLTTPLRCM
ncbi:hypothetical protein PAENIP36_03980 [Paenibacillus sp. P36]